MNIMSHILTIDVEDWFHILDNEETSTEDHWKRFPSRLEDGLERILDSFNAKNVKGTFFILGWIARRHPDAIREIVRRGHEIGSHSDMHQLVYKQSPEQFEDDLRRSLDSIAEATNICPTIYRAPGFSITDTCAWAFDILAEHGIAQDCSIFPAPRSHGGMPRFPTGTPCLLQAPGGSQLQCFPVNLRSFAGYRFIFSGGGYFRLIPLSILRRWYRESEYSMTYFHPRDFDPGQPIIPGLSLARRMKSYVGLSRALEKLENLLDEVEFVTISQAVNMIDWNKVTKIRL